MFSTSPTAVLPTWMMATQDSERLGSSQVLLLLPSVIAVQTQVPGGLCTKRSVFILPSSDEKVASRQKVASRFFVGAAKRTAHGRETGDILFYFLFFPSQERWENCGSFPPSTQFSLTFPWGSPCPIFRNPELLVNVDPCPSPPWLGKCAYTHRFPEARGAWGVAPSSSLTHARPVLCARCLAQGAGGGVEASSTDPPHSPAVGCHLT